MEEAFYESPVLRRFAGVDLGVAAAPDETTILRFRHLLEEHDLCSEMLMTVNRYLETKGIRTVQSWLGHCDIKSTMVYLKGIRSKDAAQKVNSGELAALVA